MFIQVRRWVVTEGNTGELIEKFQRRRVEASKAKQLEGLISREIFVKDVRRGEEEVMLIARWESKEAWKAWEKSPEHIAGHKKQIAENGGKPPKPEYILSMEHSTYTLVD